MADFGDEASVINEAHLAASIAAQKQRAVKLHPKGRCHYCDEKLDPQSKNIIFCDIDCRDDYEHMMKRK